MTRIRVVHDTLYTYDTPARGVVQVLRLTPQDHDGQHVGHWRIEPSVEGSFVPQADHLGNVVHIFSADEPLTELRIRASGEVTTSETAGIVRQAVERVPDPWFLRDTELTRADDAICALAQGCAGDPDETLGPLHRLLLAVNEAMTFDGEATGGAVPASEALAAGRGVCQDFAHVFVAAARHLGIPARYVSGYLLRPDTIEQAAGHAWAEARVAGLGWVGFDPTNALCITEAYVRVAIGLDQLGAAPVRGSRRGGGREGLAVRIAVERAGGAQGQRQG